MRRRYPSKNKWLLWWTGGEQGWWWLSRLLMLSPITSLLMDCRSHKRTFTCSENRQKLTELLCQKGCDQQHEVRWWPATNGTAQGLIGPVMLIVFLMIYMMGSCALSGSLQVIQNLKRQSINQMGVLPLRGTSTGWRIGLTGISNSTREYQTKEYQSSTRGSAKSCIWGGISTGFILCWGSLSWN